MKIEYYYHCPDIMPRILRNTFVVLLFVTLVKVFLGKDFVLHKIEKKTCGIERTLGQRNM